MSTKERNPSPNARLGAISGVRKQPVEERASKTGVEQHRASSKQASGRSEKPVEGTPKQFGSDRRSSRNQMRGPSPTNAERSISGRNPRSSRNVPQRTPDAKPELSPRIDNETLMAYKAMRIPSDEQGQFDLMSKMQLEIKRLARELDETRTQKVAIEAGKNELIAENTRMKSELSDLLSNQKYRNHTIKKLERELIDLRARLETERSSFVMRLAENNSKNTTPGSQTSSRSPRKQSPRSQGYSSSGVICEKCKDKIRSGQIPVGAVPLRGEDGTLEPQDYKLPDLYLKGESLQPLPVEAESAVQQPSASSELREPLWKKEIEHLQRENKALRGELEALSAIQNNDLNHLDVVQKMNDDLDRVLEERSILQQEVAHWKAQYEVANAANQRPDLAPDADVCSRAELLACQALNNEYERELGDIRERLRLSEEQLKPYLESKSREKALIETVTTLRSQLQDMTKRLLAYEQNKSPGSANATKPKPKEGQRCGSKQGAKR